MGPRQALNSSRRIAPTTSWGLIWLDQMKKIEELKHQCRPACLQSPLSLQAKISLYALLYFVSNLITVSLQYAITN